MASTMTVPQGGDAPVFYLKDEHPHPEGHSTRLAFGL